MATKYTENLLDLTDFEDDDSGSESSGSAGGGSGKPLVDPSLFGDTNHFLLEQLRIEEAKIGKGVPFTIDPNERKNKQGDLYNKGPAEHPLMQTSQKFDGAPNNKGDPRAWVNQEATENYQSQQNQLTNVPRPSSAPTLRRDR